MDPKVIKAIAIIPAREFIFCGVNLEEAYPAEALKAITGIAEPTPNMNMIKAPVKAVAIPN